ncbi:C-type lectin mosGCTL-1-like [Saccoglossus kowalevskii]
MMFPTCWSAVVLALMCSFENVNATDRYKVIQKQRTWYQARDDCESRNAHLAVIRSHQDNSDVKDLLSQDIGNVWIGVNDLYNEGTYKYVTGRDATYTNWRDGEPSDGSGRENCVEMSYEYDFKWNDCPCTLTRNYVCEYYRES